MGSGPFLFLFFLSLFVTPIVGQTQCYVSQTGSAANPGTQAAPVNSITTCLLKQTPNSPNISIFLIASNPGNIPFPPTGNSNLNIVFGSVAISGFGSDTPVPIDLQSTTNPLVALSLSATVTLTNLTIQNGGGASVEKGGVIRMTGGNLVIQGCSFSGATVNSSGAVINAVSGTSIVVASSQFSSSTAGQGVGGLIALYNTPASFSDSTFVQGSAARGGAIYIDASGSTGPTVFSGCEFTSNVADGTNSRSSAFGGGAVYVNGINLLSPSSDYPTFDNCNLSNNTSPQGEGGAIFFSGNTGGIVTGTLLANNQANHGGAVYALTGTELIISSSTFTNNLGVRANGGGSGKGGAIRGTSIFLNLTGSFFTGNAATELGGAIELTGAAALNDPTATPDSTEIVDCLFVDNIAGGSGGAIYANNLVRYLTVVGGSFQNNRADGVGELVGGGAIATYGLSRFAFRGTAFTANSAPKSMGGAVYVNSAALVSNINDSPVAYNSVFDRNLASWGGALCIDSEIVNTAYVGFQYCNFSGNVATEYTEGGQQLGGQGGAIMAMNMTFKAEQCTFSNNTAISEGGAIYCGGAVPSQTALNLCTFRDNDVIQGDGDDVSLHGDSAATFQATTLEPANLGDVQVLVAGQSILTILPANENPDVVCAIPGVSVTAHGTIYLNCTGNFRFLKMEKEATIYIVSNLLTITENILFSGGNLDCQKSSGVVVYQDFMKGSAVFTNGSPKIINCHLTNHGTMLVTRGPGTSADLSFTKGHNLNNYGRLTFSGNSSVVSAGDSLLSNEGFLSIEGTLQLANFSYSSLAKTTVLQMSLNAASSKSVSYSALTVGGEFHADGVLNLQFPTLLKGVTWKNLVVFNKRSGSFYALRGETPNPSDGNTTEHFLPQRITVSFSSKGMDVKLAASDLTGGEIFGIVFGCLSFVVIVLAIAYYFYRKRAGHTYHGEIYESINQPLYGTSTDRDN